MGVPRTYRKSSERFLASFDFQDIADGTGIVKFNGYTDKDSTGIGYTLARTAFYSAEIETTQASTITSTTFTKRLDKDFNLGEFNQLKIIRGTATIDTEFGNTKVVGTTDIEGYIVYVIKRVREGVELDLGSGQSETLTATANGQTNKTRVLLNIEITKTTFKKGDILRITLEGWQREKTAGSTTSSITIAHDPANRAGTLLTPIGDNLTTKLDVYIPFNIQL